MNQDLDLISAKEAIMSYGCQPKYGMNENMVVFTKRWDRSCCLCLEDIIRKMPACNGESSLLVTLNISFPAGSDLVSIRKRRLAGAGI